MYPPAKTNETIGAGTYEYKSLQGADYIRYLVLQPAKVDCESIICNLYTTSLGDAPPFEAISYVWGTCCDRDQPIDCDGRQLLVTRNLRDALRQVRLPDEARALWVDSICINQEDVKERGRQVYLMGRIYTQSIRTLICLGPADGNDDAEKALGVITDAEAIIQQVFAGQKKTTKTTTMVMMGASFPNDDEDQDEDENKDKDKDGDGDWNWFPDPDPNDPILRDPRWTSVGVLLQQPWFGRGWVVQEAVLGGYHDGGTRIFWGGIDISWVQLVRVYFWVIKRARQIWEINPSGGGGGGIMLLLSTLYLEAFKMQRPAEARAFQSLQAHQPLSVLETLHYARVHGLQDPRDRIYAFLALPSFGELLADLHPDYEKPVGAVYYDFATTYLNKTSDLDILQFVQNQDDINVHVEDGITVVPDNTGPPPSWVPRWDVRLHYSMHHPFWRRIHSHHHQSPSSPDLRLNPIYIDGNVLKTRGLILGTVSSSPPSWKFTRDDPARLERICSLWQDVSTRHPPSPPFMHVSKKQQSVATVTSKFPEEEDDDEKSGASLRAFLKTLRHGYREGGSKEWKAHEEAYIQALRMHIKNGGDGGVESLVTPTTTTYKENTYGGGGDSSSVAYYDEILADVSRNRRFTVLSRGYYGMAPGDTRQGDVWCIIYGTRTPFILRKTDNKSGQYKLIGDVYVLSANSAMTGDAGGERKRLGRDEQSKDWISWGLVEQDIDLV